MTTKIAKGRAISPTPTGRYYVTDLIRPPDPDGFYGPYALGLSAHSPVYTTSRAATARSACTAPTSPPCSARTSATAASASPTA